VLIVLSLVVTPLRGGDWLEHRDCDRAAKLGVIGFLYLSNTLLLIFFWFDRQHSVSGTLHEIVMRRYLWFGTSALVLMTPAGPHVD